MAKSVCAKTQKRAARLAVSAAALEQEAENVHRDLKKVEKTAKELHKKIDRNVRSRGKKQAGPATSGAFSRLRLPCVSNNPCDGGPR